MYKTLLVPVDARKRSARSIELACQIAGTFDAHVIGLFVKPSFYIPGTAYAEGFTKLLADLEANTIRELTEEAKAQFDAGVKAAKVRSPQWRTAEGDKVEVVATHAHYADLVIINQTDPEADDASHFADSVLLALGRPVLVVPYVGEFRNFGERVLVCWNGRREAARAMTDALPFLKRAKKVTVMSIDDATGAEKGELPLEEIAHLLARHGVSVEVVKTISAGVDVGNVILSRAADEGANLIVMGAYGHSRVREIVLGGATRVVLNSMTVPVLMSH